jgi:hypothetical protein
MVGKPGAIAPSRRNEVPLKNEQINRTEFANPEAVWSYS